MLKRPNSLPSRRRFLAATALAAAQPAFPLFGQESNKTGKKTLQLSVAGYPYERVRAIEEGRVSVDGCETKFERDKIGELNTHVFSGPQTRDVSEVGLIPFLLAFANDGFRDYQLLPIFVLKVFRHKSIFIATDRGIEKPQDLRGRRVATVGYSSSGLTWVRGILQDEYGVKPQDIRWVVTAKDSARQQTGGASKWEKLLPPGLDATQAPKGKDESDLLLDGDVDAIFHPAEPRVYVERHPKVARLFRDARKVEQAYFKKTGIFPIMHAVAIRKELLDAEPWLASAVYSAYERSKELDYEEMRRIRWAYSSLPWFGQEFDETRALMGKDFYSYGVRENRKALETIFRYLDEQQLTERRLRIEEVFPKSLVE